MFVSLSALTTVVLEDIYSPSTAGLSGSEIPVRSSLPKSNRHRPSSVTVQEA